MIEKTGTKRPGVGIGVIVINSEGKVLIGKRKGSHAPYYSIPGGHLELGETFEQAAIKEIKEETNLDIVDPKVICVTNNLETYKEEGKHYISIIMLAEKYSGELKNMEPDKNEDWIWVETYDLPEPHFDASKDGINCFIKGEFYNHD